MTEKPFSLVKQSVVSVVSVLICVLSVLICFLAFAKTAKATTLKNVSYTVTVTATVGEPKLTIYGYTSPYAQVKLSGIGVGKETTADEYGYFFFNRVFLPYPTFRWVSNYIKTLAYPEIYLLAVDTDTHTSSPLPLPPLPLGPYDIYVGPVLLSPTLVLEKGKFLSGEQVLASGQTIPDSKVNIFLANEVGMATWWQKILKKLFPHQAAAYFIPEYQIKADKTGRFQFNLPSLEVQTWRVFASTFYLDSPSPKSNTLKFRLLSFWQWLWERIKEILGWLFTLIKPHLWSIIILLECVVIGLTLIYWRNLRRYGQQSSLGNPR